MEIKKSDFKCICCGNYCYEEVWGENDTILVCYVCKRQSELKKAEERKAKKNEQFMKCAELLQELLQTDKEVTYKAFLTDIRDYLVAILDEWHRRSDEPNFLENNIMVYNHIRKELDDLTEYAEKLGVEI
jgi:hypothetical protein